LLYLVRENARCRVLRGLERGKWYGAQTCECITRARTASLCDYLIVVFQTDHQQSVTKRKGKAYKSAHFRWGPQG
jgi:hypothetical protein